MDEIKEHYIKQAKEYGLSKKSTMKDVNTREKEVEVILKYLKILAEQIENPKILELGCGNGYTAEQIIKRLDLKNYTGVDFCEDFVKLANQRNLSNVKFQTGNVLSLNFEDSSFDIVFTERCLINLDSWDKQKGSLDEIRRILKLGGYFIMIEAFTDGLENLNEARNTLGLESVPQPFHNIFFDKEKFLDFIKSKFQLYEDDLSVINFLSSYYFGSRVMYPALIAGKKDLVYNNKFVEFFRYIPSYGNYCSIQCYILKKI